MSLLSRRWPGAAWANRRGQYPQARVKFRPLEDRGPDTLVPGEQIRLRRLPHETRVLSEGAITQGPARYRRRCPRSRARLGQHRGFRDLTPRAQEGRNGLRPPQTHPQAQPLKAQGSLRCPRRNPPGCNSPEPEKAGHLCRSISARAEGPLPRMNKLSGSKAQIAQKPLPNRGADQSTIVKTPAKAHDLQIKEFCNSIPPIADILVAVTGFRL